MKPHATVVYYTSNREDEAFETKIREKLLAVIGDLPLISVSQKPIDFGQNICVGDIGVSNQNVFRQLQMGAKMAKTPFIISAESDCLYPKPYFEFIPKNVNQCYRYDNLWIMYKNSHAGFVQKAYSECAQIWGRLALIKQIDRVLKGRGTWQPVLEHGRRVPRMFPKPTFEFFHHEIPVINIKTAEGMHRFTVVNENQSRYGIRELPFWGKVENLREELFG